MAAPTPTEDPPETDDPVMNVMHHSFSTRVFSGSPVPEDKRTELAEYIKTLVRGPFGTPVRYALTTGDCGVSGFVFDCRSAVVGACGPGEGADGEMLREMDFAWGMEAAMIRARQMGIGTLWLALTFDFAKAGTCIESDEKLYAVNAIGLPQDPGIMSRMTSFVFRRHGRHNWQHMFFSETFGTKLRPQDVGQAEADCLNAVRRAPSAKNMQRWRIVRCGPADARVWHFYTEPGEWMLLDAGIAVCRWETAARLVGLAGSWTREAPDSAALQVPHGNVYLVSWIEGQPQQE